MDLRKLLLLACVVLWPASGWATLTAESYLRLEYEVRQLTLEGMEQRIALLQAGASLDDEERLDSRIRTSIDEVYRRYGTTPGAHAAFGNRETAAIGAWLDQNFSWKYRFQWLNSRFEALSQQIRALRGE